MKNQAKTGLLKALVVGSLSFFTPTVLAETERKPDLETSSDRYKTRFKGQTGKWFLQHQEEHLIQMLAPWKGASILDIGGGHGQYTERLVEEGYDVTILGSSPDANEQVQHLLASKKCQYLVGNLLDVPVPDKSFDVVLSFRLLAHLPEWPALIGQASRTARKAVIVDFPILQSFNALYPLLFKVKCFLEKNTTRSFQIFHEQEVVDEFKKSGFWPSSRFPQYFLPMVVHRVLHTPVLSRKAEDVFRRIGLTQRFGSPVILCAEPKVETCSVGIENVLQG